MSALSRLMAKAKKQGPCLICGQPGHLARHRLWDSIDTNLRAGEPVSGIAWWYAVPVQEVRDVREAFAEARRRKRALPGRGQS